MPLLLPCTLSSGVRINLDNFEELRRVAALVEKDPGHLRNGKALIGLRINPQVGDWIQRTLIGAVVDT